MNNGKMESFISETLMAIRYWLPPEKKDDWIYVSGLYLVVSRIIEVLITRMKDCGVDDWVLVRILMWGMLHEYYTTGEYGEKLRDILDEEWAKQKAAKWKFVKTPVSQLRTKLIPFHTEYASQKRNEAEYKLWKFLTGILKGKIPVMTMDILKAATTTSIIEPELLKFDKEGIKITKEDFPNDPDIVKGFQQTRILRKCELYEINLLICIVAAIYQEEELFLYFDPYHLRLWICDRKNLVIKRDHVNLIMSFTNILHSIFCEHCIKIAFGKFDIDFSTLTPDETADVLKKMLDDLYSQLSKVCPDDLTVTVEWKVEDMWKFAEVDEAITHWKVGFDKHDGKKKWIIFKVKKNLNSYRKKIK